MTTTTFEQAVTLATVACCNCGVVFAMPADLRAKRVADKETFWCPNGHSQHFTGTSDADRAKKAERDLAQMRDVAESHRKMASHNAALALAAEDALKAEKAEAARLAKRAKAGVCPCCNRTFRQLALHMKKQHPEA